MAGGSTELKLAGHVPVCIGDVVEMESGHQHEVTGVTFYDKT